MMIAKTLFLVALVASAVICFRAMMDRRMGAIALLFLSLLASPADACNRCGLFGRHCRYQQSYYYPAKYVAPVSYPASVQTFNFVNSYPVPALTNSLYGYSLASQAYTVDSALVLDRASRFQELALQAATKANEGFTASASSALAIVDANDRRTKNTLLALSAIEANGQSGQQPGTLSFRATVRDGRLSVERLVDPAPGGLALRLEDGRLSCARCHDGRAGEGRPPTDLVFDGVTPITEEHLRLATVAVMEGRMPPNANWSIAQRSEVVVKLAKSLGQLPPVPDGGLQ